MMISDSNIEDAWNAQKIFVIIFGLLFACNLVITRHMYDDKSIKEAILEQYLMGFTVLSQDHMPHDIFYLFTLHQQYCVMRQ